MGTTTYRVFAATVYSTTQCNSHEHLAYLCVTCPSTVPHPIPDDEDDGETLSAPDPHHLSTGKQDFPRSGWSDHKPEGEEPDGPHHG